jgi:hypothetical protein
MTLTIQQPAVGTSDPVSVGSFASGSLIVVPDTIPLADDDLNDDISIFDEQMDELPTTAPF